MISDAIGTLRAGRPSMSPVTVDPSWQMAVRSFEGARFHVVTAGHVQVSGPGEPKRGRATPSLRADVVAAHHRAGPLGAQSDSESFDEHGSQTKMPVPQR